MSEVAAAEEAVAADAAEAVAAALEQSRRADAAEQQHTAEAQQQCNRAYCKNRLMKLRKTAHTETNNTTFANNIFLQLPLTLHNFLD